MAEINGLLNRRTGQTVPGVRIPPSPQKNNGYKMRERFVPVFYFIKVNPGVDVSKAALFFTATQLAVGVVV